MQWRGTISSAHFASTTSGPQLLSADGFKKMVADQAISVSRPTSSSRHRRAALRASKV
jgi:hypothetical protein